MRCKRPSIFKGTWLLPSESTTAGLKRSNTAALKLLKRARPAVLHAPGPRLLQQQQQHPLPHRKDLGARQLRRGGSSCAPPPSHAPPGPPRSSAPARHRPPSRPGPRPSIPDPPPHDQQTRVPPPTPGLSPPGSLSLAPGLLRFASSLLSDPITASKAGSLQGSLGPVVPR